MSEQSLRSDIKGTLIWPILIVKPDQAVAQFNEERGLYGLSVPVGKLRIFLLDYG
jgi:hypothetical protein